MKLNSKNHFISSQFARSTIISSLIIIVALFALYSYAEVPPALSANGDNGTGKFEKMVKKSKKADVVPSQQNDESIAPVVSNDEAKEQVIPLPIIDDEIIDDERDDEIDEDDEDVAESIADTDNVIITVIAEDTAEVQSSFSEKEQEDTADDQWPGWLTDYRKACQQGKSEQKMVLVYFYDTNLKSPYTAFETDSLVDEEVQKSLEDYILVRIPVTAKLAPAGEQGTNQLPGVGNDQKQLDETPIEFEEDVTVLTEKASQSNGKGSITQTKDGKPQPTDGTRYTVNRPRGETIDATKLIAPGRDMGSVAQLKAEPFDLTFSNLKQEIMLIRHPAFYEMLNTPGITIIDFKHKDAEYYGKIVSVFPFLKKKPYTVEQTRKMLTLPPGTVTQRSVIFAVRIHPDHPLSTEGELSPRLVEEARSASQYQADIRKQGHHNWDRRFQLINTYLPTELWACEVCAESWEGQHLLESAIDCVASWRYSEGHWSAVSAEHPYYGYDMKLGTNGIWYGTGVFGKWRHPTLAKAGTLSGGQSQLLPKR